MSGCPYCRSSIDVTDTAGNPWYSCGSNNKFRSMACVDREPLSAQLRQAHDRIKRMEEAVDTAIRYCEFYGPVGATPDTTKLLLKELRKAKEVKP